MTGRLVIVGSGETSPTMVKVHRQLLERAPVRAMLDTPYGFQVNADDLNAKIGQYFAESVGFEVEVGRWRRKDDPVADRERTLALLRRADWVFAGPGSPSYALTQWHDTPVPSALTEVITRGGTVVLGSAAAVTSGSHAIPVYEVYKVGADPYWLEGLDLLTAAAGITAAVVPHYDNREGGRHDTRFCYLGEERLELLEEQLPDGVGVLGVDEHTAVVIDASTGTVSVHGSGGLTMRYRQSSAFVPAGESLTLEQLRAGLAGSGSGAAAASASPATALAPPLETTEEDAEAGQPSVRAAAMEQRARFDACLAAGDADGALAACLDLEDAIHQWSADTLTGPEHDAARQILRSMLVDLAARATSGLRDPREVLDPFVQLALDLRRQARENRDFATSDLIRDRLGAVGVEVRDTPDGMVWELNG